MTGQPYAILTIFLKKGLDKHEKGAKDFNKET
jgi:hypothetical protein